MMDAAVRRIVRDRAADRCEDCDIPRTSDAFFEFHVERILQWQHGESSEPQNLAWSCSFCNRYQGPNLAGVDPETGDVTRLFHPRRDEWARHVTARDGMILGVTPGGRTTVQLLWMNDPLRVALRRETAS